MNDDFELQQIDLQIGIEYRSSFDLDPDSLRKINQNDYRFTNTSELEEYINHCLSSLFGSIGSSLITFNISNYNKQ